ncbi:MAG: septum site-determining protein MinC [Anaerolineales bacterium]
MTDSVSIKGTREGLTITFGDGEFANLLERLDQHLATRGAFFRGGRVALQVGDQAIDQKQLGQIQELLSGYGMILRTVVSGSGVTQEASNAMGLRLIAPESDQERVREKPSPAPQRSMSRQRGESRGILIKRMVRSGQVVRHTGHIVIIGDVNAGATIAAGGDIVIWGRLYGIAHAGCMGDTSAIICALEMSPLQLRIADFIARPEENPPNKTPYPEIARAHDGRIVVERWNENQ